jgi:hypothetical protein
VVSGAKYAGKWYFKIYCLINMKFYQLAFGYNKSGLFSQKVRYKRVALFSVNSSCNTPFSIFIFGGVVFHLIIFHPADKPYIAYLRKCRGNFLLASDFTTGLSILGTTPGRYQPVLPSYPHEPVAGTA